jgi:AcrR family transcriptional regulator
VVRHAAQKARLPTATTKARILAVAEQVFAAKGFEGASTREIASKAEVNISSLHYHWDCKETLYFAVFQHIYQRIVELVREVSTLPPEKPVSMPEFVEQAMGRLFDFFLDNPTIPRLLVRRLVEDENVDVEIERDVLVPAWKVFSGWTANFRGTPLSDTDSMMFMLTTYSTMLCFLLDGREFRRLLGGSVRKPQVRTRVRTHLIQLSQRLLQLELK